MTMYQKIKSSLIFTVFIFSSQLFLAQDVINVSVINLRNDKGHVLISLFRECEGYPDKPEKAFRKVRVGITGKSSFFVFSDVPPGNYSIAILHDENDDQKMNTNFFGFPKEGYGFSNNVMGTFGPPSCSRASFRHIINSGERIIIQTRYGW